MTLKDATNEALRDWVNHVDDTFYILGSVVGPHPYPMMVRDFQSIIGLEARQQILAQAGQLPDMAVACVGGGSNAMGLFYGFLEDAAVQLIGVEAAGHGLDRQHAATLSAGSPGVLHGTFSYLLQDSDGQIAEAHSISAGLDYPGVGPEHAYLKDQGRVGHRAITDTQALEAFQFCARTEGILAALEPSHALAAVMQLAPTMTPDQHLVVNLCGRGDKDIFTIAEALKDSVVMPDIPTTSSKPAHASITGAAS
jgi:tryptophan synthase beta chain